MRPARLAARLIRLAAWLVPASLRDDWRREWHAELASLADLPPTERRAITRAAGAFADAFWLRQRQLADTDWIDDLRLGLRQLAARRAFGVTAIAILAVGLAAALTMFSIATQVLLRPLPYPDPEAIVTVWETRGSSDELLDVAPGNFLDWRARSRAFVHLVGIAPHSLDVHAGGRPEVWSAARVTAGFFETFATTPLAGRFFTADEYVKGRDQVAVIGEAFWRQRFAADPAILGRSFRTDDGAVTIVGVVPATFEPRVLPTATGFRDVWLPKAIEEYEPRIRASGFWAVVGRLRSDVDLAAANADLAAVSRQLAAEYPRTNTHASARAVPLRDHLVGNVRLALSLLAGAVGMVLLIACVNVANLLLARGAAREREMAVRVALGARRGRLVRQLLVESSLLAAAGTLAGTVLAAWALAALARFGPRTVPWIESLHVDGQALAFAAALAVTVTLLSGGLPAWRTARRGLASAGRHTATADPSQHRVRAALVVAEVALALILVTGASLLVRSFVNLLQVDLGFARDRVVVAQVFAWGNDTTVERLQSFFDRTLARLEALPAVEAAGAVSAMPFIESNINIEGPITIPGHLASAAEESPRAHFTIATPGYFQAMQIPLLRGRHLATSDSDRSGDVAVISATLADRYWPNADPIGATIGLQFSGQPMQVRVVGVVGSLRHDRPDRAVRDELFIPLAQRPFGSMTFVVRGATDASVLLEPTRAAIWAVNPEQTIFRSATLDELVQKTISTRQFALAVIVGFALVALLLAIAGVYSVLSALMEARAREVGVRLALGANRGDILLLVLRRGLGLALAGLLLGLAGAIGVGRMLASFLFDVAPADPAALITALGVMALAALAASYRPAHRAANANPITVLRMD